MVPLQQPLELPNPNEANEFFRKKLVFTTGPKEVEGMLKRGEKINVVDVRAAEDFKKGHIPGSRNLPKDQWESLEGLKQDLINIMVCYTQVCHLAATAAYFFSSKGFPVMEMEGGFKAWKEYDMDIEKG